MLTEFSWIVPPAGIVSPIHQIERLSYLTLTLLEISARTGKRHDNVMADIRIMLDQLGGDAPNFRATYRDTMNREKPCYRLPKRETLILVSGYSVALRAAIVDRWAELEAALAKPALPDFSDPVASARAWADAKEGELAAISNIAEW